MKYWNDCARVAVLALIAVPRPLLAQEEAEGGGATLFDVNLGLSLWTVVVFVLLLVVLGKFAWGPILEAAQTREQRIQSALDEAALRQAEAATLLEEHRAQLAQGRRKAQYIVNEGKAAGELVRKEIEEKARAEGQALIERAKREIDREKDVALDEIRKSSVDLALAATARLIQEKLDPEKDRRLVAGYLDELSQQGEGPDRGARA
jgi:F-type H+-transporting ATPase subunit b